MKMATTDSIRLEKLERELTEQREKTSKLESEIARLRGERQTKPAVTKPEEGVKIISPAPSNGEFVMPTSDELARLREIVFAKYPSLRPQFSRKWEADDERQYVEGFTNSFLALGYIDRAEIVDTKHYLLHWQENAAEILRAMGKAGRIDGFLVAAIGHGDIPYRLPDANKGIVAELGLHHYGSGRRCKNAWRAVLATGRVLAPAPIVSRPLYSQPRVLEAAI
jgi:hypothetical protein